MKGEFKIKDLRLRSKVKKIYIFRIFFLQYFLHIYWHFRHVVQKKNNKTQHDITSKIYGVYFWDFLSTHAQRCTYLTQAWGEHASFCKERPLDD